MTYAYKWQLHVNSYSLGFSLSGKLPTSKLSEISHLFRGPFFGEHYNQRFILCYGTAALSVGLSCLSVLSVCNIGVLWPNGWMDQDATWYEDRPRPRPHCFRWGPSSPRKGAQHRRPHFSAHGYCGQTAGWITIPLGTEVASAQAILCIWKPSSPTERGTAAPTSRPMSIEAKR